MAIPHLGPPAGPLGANCVRHGVAYCRGGAADETAQVSGFDDQVATGHSKVAVGEVLGQFCGESESLQAVTWSSLERSLYATFLLLASDSACPIRPW